MSIIDTTRPVAASTGVLGQIFANTFGAFAEWNAERVTRAALNRLSDRELDDIGLCRGDIDQVSRRF